MFLHHIEKILQPIGTQHVHTAFGRSNSTIINIKKTFTIEFEKNKIITFPLKITTLLPLPKQQQNNPYHRKIDNCSDLDNWKSVLKLYVVIIWCEIDSVYYIVVCVCSSLITVRSLYEGTLVTSRTTAPTVPKRSCWISTAQLAAFSLFLATLTLAARCYASITTNATHPNPLVVQLKPPTTTITPNILSPIYNSNTHSSNLVLSRLYNKPHQLVQSDTSVILTNSKVLLYYNKNFITKRTKRELKTNTPNRINNIIIKESTLSSATAAAPLSPSSSSSSPSSTSSSTNSIPSPVNYSYNVRNNRKAFAIRTTRKNNDILLNNFKEKRNDDIDVILRTLNNSDDKVLNRIRVNSTQVTPPPASPTLIEHQQNDSSFIEDKNGAILEENQSFPRSTARSMPPVHAHDNESSGAVSEWSLFLVVLVVLTGAALGLVTCLLNHQEGTGGVRGAATPPSNPHLNAETPTTAPMLSVVSAGAAAGMGGMDRLRGGRAARDLAATRDRQVRLHAVHTDIAINLPPSIAMPDGEEHPFTSSRLHLRDAEQESEIYQKCIRPPPNRTVLESESPPPYRSNSAGVLASSTFNTSSSSSSSSSSTSEWSTGSAPLVVRCHSMSSSSSISKPLASYNNTQQHPHQTGCQKTDFLQRTVKIFTGKKTSTQQPPPPPAPTLPIVIVPTSSSSSTSAAAGAVAGQAAVGVGASSSAARKTTTQQQQQQQQITADTTRPNNKPSPSGV